MLKKNEIRVGNWVSKDGETYRATTDTTTIIERGATIEGVLITKELLSKYNFIEKENDWFSLTYYTDIMEANEEFSIQYNLSSKRFCFFETSEKEYEQYPIHTKHLIKYIHQLQNLIFILTNEELESVE